MAVESGTLPWTKSCFVCGEDNRHGLGLKSRLEDGCVVINYTPRDCDRGWKHIVHGGITITLMDEVMTWAAMLEVKSACVSIEITSRIRQPIVVGEPIRIEGMVASCKSRMIITEAKVLSADGVLLATATGKYIKMPPDKVSLCKDDFVWDSDSILPADVLKDSE
jgi:acyl-coenzyme A thioesterase PaaI-like protein